MSAKHKPLKIALPVMMHDESEIEAFIQAKNRLEDRFDASCMPVEVGVFLYFNSRAITEEAMKAQIVNQKKYKLPIFHAQGTIFYQDSLAFDLEEAEKFRGLQSNTPKTITQVARMRDLGRENDFSDNITMEVHPGITVYPDFRDGIDNQPLVYSVRDFAEKRRRLMQIMQHKYHTLKELSRREGVYFGIENSHTASFEPDVKDPNRTPRLSLRSFNTLGELAQITGRDGGSIDERFLVCDVAHYSTSRIAPNLLASFGNQQRTNTLLEVVGVHNMPEYNLAIGTIDENLRRSRVVHLSNCTGMGVHLAKYPELEKIWGKDGTITGNLSRDELQEICLYARKNNLPVAMELDYDVRNIKNSKFREADNFLDYIISG